MLDSFFSRGFKAAKCKTLLKLTIPRVKLLRNRREVHIKQMRREIAKLLETGQEATARIRVEHVIREEKMMAAQEIIELFCELIVARLPIIEAQSECPLDLKEAISSVCFAAPRCADLPELLQVQTMFAGKYGKEFVSAATELMPECGVNRKLVELLSVRAPATDLKLKLLKEIAEEHELDWDPNASESELLKPHEDLLNGSTQVIGGSKSSLPKEKHDDTNYSANEQAQAASEEFDSDEDFEIVDLPEVPKQPLHSTKNTVSVASDEENENLSNLVQHNSVAKESESMEAKQFVPFISPTSKFSASFSVGEDDPCPSVLGPESETTTDLQDVLLAAEAAAETADRAAAAARSVASLAQLRISELSKKTSNVQSDACIENPFHEEMHSRENANSGLVNSGSPSPSQEKETLDACIENPFHEEMQGIETANFSSPRRTREGECGDELEHYSAELPVYDDTDCYRPQRLGSMDDDMIFAYPNLFSSQGRNLSPNA